MTQERLLNKYYDGRFNSRALIGPMMAMIRELKPLTAEDFRNWYLKNVHDEDYLKDLAEQMQKTIPAEHNVDVKTCYDYINDVMFRRTFNGYNREKPTLKYLQAHISPAVLDSPEEWDAPYFIDFYIPKDEKHPLIGIQLKPDTFYYGKIYKKVNIEGKLKDFRDDFNAKTFILIYDSANSTSDNIIFTNPEVLDEIKKAIQ